MKPDDKFPEEMLDDIREKAVKARDAAYDLFWAIKELQSAYPTHSAHHEIAWWESVAANFSYQAITITHRAKELADAEEGGER